MHTHTLPQFYHLGTFKTKNSIFFFIETNVQGKFNEFTIKARGLTQKKKKKEQFSMENLNIF